MTLFYIFIVLGVLVQALDFHSTYLALKNGARESNPIVNWMIDKLGKVLGLALAKSIGVVATITLVHLSMWIPLTLVFILYSYVIWNNYRLAKII